MEILRHSKKYIHGDIETEQKILGRNAHGKLIEKFEKTTLKEGWKRIFSPTRVMPSEFIFFAMSQYLHEYILILLFSHNNIDWQHH